MADKIIIDGINVEDIEKCEFCTRICKNTKETTPLCKLYGFCSYVDCYFKQLKRKEQECEQKERDINRLKKCVYDSFKIQEDSERCWKKECNKLTQKLKEKEQECEKLKSQLNNNQKEDDRGYCETYDCKYYNNLEKCQKQNCWYKNYSKEHIKNVQLKKLFQAKEQECEELKETIKAYKEDRFCQGGCAIYQYDKIHKLTQTLDEIEEMVRNYDDWDLHKDILDIINNAKEE